MNKITREYEAIFTSALEGYIDEAILKHLANHIGVMIGTVYGKQGKEYLKKRINGYNKAAQYSPWVILIDLDDDAACAPDYKNGLLKKPSQYLCFRIAVRSIESWLMADRIRLSKFLCVALSKIPSDPDNVENPKIKMVELARASRKKDVIKDMVPRSGSGRKVGPAYSSRLIEFIYHPINGWRPDIAANNSNSLKSALECLEELKEKVNNELLNLI